MWISSERNDSFPLACDDSIEPFNPLGEPESEKPANLLGHLICSTDTLKRVIRM